jgi:hypothetical protein
MGGRRKVDEAQVKKEPTGYGGDGSLMTQWGRREIEGKRKKNSKRKIKFKRVKRKQRD